MANEMERLYFLFKGSAKEPYQVEFVKRSETNISAYCTCRAGQMGQYCKHRFGIIEGNPNGIISDNPEDSKTVQSWIPGTDIEEAMNTVRVIEDEAKEVKRRLTAARKAVAQAMRD